MREKAKQGEVHTIGFFFSLHQEEQGSVIMGKATYLTVCILRQDLFLFISAHPIHFFTPITVQLSVSCSLSWHFRASLQHMVYQVQTCNCLHNSRLAGVQRPWYTTDVRMNTWLNVLWIQKDNDTAQNQIYSASPVEYTCLLLVIHVPPASKASSSTAKLRSSFPHYCSVIPPPTPHLHRASTCSSKHFISVFKTNPQWA